MIRACSSSFIAACVAGVLLFGTSDAGTNVWTIKGPPGGELRRLEASQTNDNVLYAAYERSVHKSTDGGASWQTVRDFYGHVMDMAVDPTDGNRIYVSVQEEGLFRSNDGGTTFTAIAPASLLIRGIGVVANVVYYNSDFAGTFRSTDYGETWSARGTLPMPISRWVVDSSNPDSIYAYFAGQDSLMIRSTDGGTTWTLLAGTPGGRAVLSLKVLSPSYLVAATWDGIYVSTDSGATWTLKLSGEYLTLATDPNAPTTLLTATGRFFSTGQLLRSTDSGLTWTPFSTTPTGAAEGIAVSRLSSTSIVFANEQGVQRTVDNGATWSEAVPGPLSSAASLGLSLELATTVAPDSKVYAFSSAGSGGLFSSSGESAWQRLNLGAAQGLVGGNVLGPTKLAVKPGNPNTLFLGTYSYGVLRSTSGGATWTAPSNDLISYSFNAIDFDPGNTEVMYAGVYRFGTPISGGIYRSTNGGATWAPYPIGLADARLLPQRLVIDPANPLRKFVVAMTSDPFDPGTSLHRSIDGGASWGQVLSREFPLDILFSPVDPDKVFLASSGGVLISNDGGASFTASSQFALIANRSPSSIALDPEVPTTLYAATFGPADATVLPQRSSWVMRSVDSGQSWEVLRGETDSPTWFVNRLVLDPSNPNTLYVNTGFRGVATLEIAPDLAVTINGHTGTKPIGGASSFDLRAQNLGPYAATLVRIAATLPAELTGVTAAADRGSCTVASSAVTCMAPTLRFGEVVNVHVTYTAPAAMTLPVSATISAHERDPIPSNNSASASVVATEVVDLSASITPSADTVNKGDSLTYTLQVRNNGPSNASAATVTFMPGTGLALTTAPSGCSMNNGAMICNVGGLTVGAIRSFAIATVTQSSGAVTALASVVPAATAVDPNASNDSVSASIQVRPEGDLSVTIVDSVDPVIAGSNFDYRLAIRNAGPEAMPNVVVTLNRVGGVAGTVSTTQGACTSITTGVRCDLGLLVSGISASIIMTVSSGAPGTVSLQANVMSDGNDRVVGNNSAQESTIVNAAPPSKQSGGGKVGWQLLLVLVFGLVLRARFMMPRAHPLPELSRVRRGSK